MNIIVAIKQVPDTSEVVDVVEIDDSGRSIREGRLVAKINDWDEYSVTEAVRLKQELGGMVTVITVGPDAWDETLRRALAIGADNAIRIDSDVSSEDPYIVAVILKTVIQRLPHDLLLFGAQSEDFGSGQLGAMVAEMLDVPHATLVTSVEAKEKTVKINRELEAGTLETYTIKLPALLTIQSGINRPRYISFSNIRKARAKELKVMSLDQLGLSQEILKPKVKLEKLELPPAGEKAELITGAPEETAEKLAQILKEAGIY